MRRRPQRPRQRPHELLSNVRKLVGQALDRRDHHLPQRVEVLRSDLGLEPVTELGCRDLSLRSRREFSERHRWLFAYHPLHGIRFWNPRPEPPTESNSGERMTQ